MTISPPDMVLEAGNSSTLARWNVPPSKSRTAFWSFRSLNLCVDSLGQGASSACEMGTIGPDWMYVSPLGNTSKKSVGRLKLAATMSFGVTLTQSVIENVPCSENAPLSKDRMKWHGLSPMHWIEWAGPLAKYHRPPGSELLLSLAPAGPITTGWHGASMTKGHSAAMACQCSSRDAPGLRNM